MQLFAEQLGEILTALGDTPAASRHGEKRSFFRIGARYRIAVRRRGTSAATAWLRDVSAGGVGMLLSQASPPRLGTALAVELPRKDGSVAFIACIVRNASQFSPGTQQVGASFLLPVAELRKLLAPTRPLAKSA